jgi:hypothetical protein
MSLTGTPERRAEFRAWVEACIAPRNLGGFLDPDRHNLYPLDVDLLVQRHALLGLDRDALVAALPLLRASAPSTL